MNFCTSFCLLSLVSSLLIARAADVPGERDSFPGWLGTDYTQPPPKKPVSYGFQFGEHGAWDVNEMLRRVTKCPFNLDIMCLRRLPSTLLSELGLEPRDSAVRMEASCVSVQELSVRSGVQPHHHQSQTAPREVTKVVEVAHAALSCRHVSSGHPCVFIASLFPRVPCVTPCLVRRMYQVVSGQQLEWLE